MKLRILAMRSGHNRSMAFAMTNRMTYKTIFGLFSPEYFHVFRVRNTTGSSFHPMIVQNAGEFKKVSPSILKIAQKTESPKILFAQKPFYDTIFQNCS